jgi:hypothetical protein
LLEVNNCKNCTGHPRITKKGHTNMRKVQVTIKTEEDPPEENT